MCAAAVTAVSYEGKLGWLPEKGDKAWLVDVSEEDALALGSEAARRDARDALALWVTTYCKKTTNTLNNNLKKPMVHVNPTGFIAYTFNDIEKKIKTRAKVTPDASTPAAISSGTPRTIGKVGRPAPARLLLARPSTLQPER